MSWVSWMFAERYGIRYGKPAVRIAEDALPVLESYFTLLFP